MGGLLDCLVSLFSLYFKSLLQRTASEGEGVRVTVLENDGDDSRKFVVGRLGIRAVAVDEHAAERAVGVALELEGPIIVVSRRLSRAAARLWERSRKRVRYLIYKTNNIKRHSRFSLLCSGELRDFKRFGGSVVNTMPEKGAHELGTLSLRIRQGLV